MVATIMALLIGAATGSAASGPSPATLYAKAVANAKSQVGVYESEVVTRRGARIEWVSNDVGSKEGRQVFHWATGASAQVLGFHALHKVFFEGNALGLVNYFSFPKAEGVSLAGRWLELVPGNAGYTGVLAATWLASDFSQSMLTKPLRFAGYATIAGQHVRAIVGVLTQGPAFRGPGTLYVTTTGEVLPVELHAKSGAYVITTVWTGWGHVVNFGIPGNALTQSAGTSD